MHSAEHDTTYKAQELQQKGTVRSNMSVSMVSLLPKGVAAARLPAAPARSTPGPPRKEAPFMAAPPLARRTGAINSTGIFAGPGAEQMTQARSQVQI